MALNDFGILNTQAGAQLGAALDPAVAQERNNKLADMAIQRQYQNMQLQDVIAKRNADALAKQQMQEAQASLSPEDLQQIRLGMSYKDLMEQKRQKAAMENYAKAIQPIQEARPLEGKVIGNFDTSAKGLNTLQMDINSPQFAALPIEDQQGIREAMLQQGIVKPTITQQPAEVRDAALYDVIASGAPAGKAMLTMRELQARQDEARQAREDRAAQAKQAMQERFAQDERMARLAASLRPAPQEPLMPVMQPDKSVVYMPRSQAVGMPVGSAASSMDKPLTEGQAKEVGYGTRAQEASKILDQIGSNYSPAKLNAATAVENVPLVGWAANSALGDNEQMIGQAQRNFINAVLRQESGAAIASSEFANAKKQYFPQPGDSEAVKAQKKANRERVIKSFQIGSGPGAKNFAQPESQPTVSGW